MMVGLAAPAFAAAPVISSFTPDSGSELGGCIVVVTGTGLDDFATATWTFESTTPPASLAAADYVLASDTEAWVKVPATVAPGVSYTIKVVNSGGTSTSTGTFLATTGAGNCAPTITSVTPNCGSHNDKVVIVGTNLLLDGAGANDIAGGTVSFSPFTDDASVVPPDSDDSTTLTRFVSTNAGDGPVRVTAGGGTGFSTASFQVPPPDCVAGGTVHARSISFKITKKGKASGVVKSTEDPAFTACAAAVPVKIQKKKKGDGWKTVGTATTNDTGAYTKKVKNPKGKQSFRALAPKVGLGDPVTDTCSKATSAVRKA